MNVLRKKMKEMKTVKILFSAVCIMFLHSISVGLSAQHSLDSIVKGFSGSDNVWKSLEILSTNHYINFVIKDDEQLSNEFVKVFNSERGKASHFCKKQTEGKTCSESCGFEDRENNVIYVYSYDRKDCSNMEIVYVKSNIFPQKRIAEQDSSDPNDEQMFEDFVDKLKADANIRKEASDVRADAAAERAKATAERAKATAERAKAAAERAKATAERAKATAERAKEAGKLSEADSCELKDSADVKSVKPKYYVSKGANFYYEGEKITVKEAKEMGLDVEEID
jgi:hypothetical protein